MFSNATFHLLRLVCILKESSQGATNQPLILRWNFDFQSYRQPQKNATLRHLIIVESFSTSLSKGSRTFESPSCSYLNPFLSSKDQLFKYFKMSQ